MSVGNHFFAHCNQVLFWCHKRFVYGLQVYEATYSYRCFEQHYTWLLDSSTVQTISIDGITHAFIPYAKPNIFSVIFSSIKCNNCNAKIILFWLETFSSCFSSIFVIFFKIFEIIHQAILPSFLAVCDGEEQSFIVAVSYHGRLKMQLENLHFVDPLTD